MRVGRRSCQVRHAMRHLSSPAASPVSLFICPVPVAYPTSLAQPIVLVGGSETACPALGACSLQISATKAKTWPRDSDGSKNHQIRAYFSHLAHHSDHQRTAPFSNNALVHRCSRSESYHPAHGMCATSIFPKSEYPFCEGTMSSGVQSDPSSE